MKMNIVLGDDWIGVYLDGRLRVEGHSIEPYEAVKLAIENNVHSVEQAWCHLPWLHDRGDLPGKIENVKFEGDKS